MPQYNVTQAFHYAAGGTVARFRKGVQPLSPAVAEHALSKGFAELEQPTKQRRTPAATATVEES